MSAAQALSAARAVGIHLEVDGDDLLLEASAPPPSAILQILSQHKAEIVAVLRPGRDGWSAEDWRSFFEERAAITEFDDGLSRTEAEAKALACCIVEWVNRNPTPSAPGRCVSCGQAESRDAAVLPYGTEPGTHIWLHAECWPAWQKVRRSQATEALMRMGVGTHDCVEAAPAVIRQTSGMAIAADRDRDQTNNHTRKGTGKCRNENAKAAATLRIKTNCSEQQNDHWTKNVFHPSRLSHDRR